MYLVSEVELVETEEGTMRKHTLDLLSWSARHTSTAKS